MQEICININEDQTLEFAEVTRNLSFMKFRFASFFFALLLASASGSARDFVTNTTVIGCGPKKPESFSSEEMINAYKYFFVHKAKNGDYVIWHDNFQYASFEQKQYHQLYVQNGGHTSTTFQVVEGIERYSLIFKETSGSTRKRILLIDNNSMTFVSRIPGYQPTMGVCWREKN